MLIYNISQITFQIWIFTAILAKILKKNRKRTAFQQHFTLTEPSNDDDIDTT